MKNPIIRIFAALIGAIIGYSIVHQFQSSNANFDQSLVHLANELNKNLPMMVDRETRWDTSTAEPGNKFLYIYTVVNHSKDELDVPSLKNTLRPQLITTYKTSE